MVLGRGEDDAVVVLGDDPADQVQQGGDLLVRAGHEEGDPQLGRERRFGFQTDELRISEACARELDELLGHSGREE